MRSLIALLSFVLMTSEVFAWGAGHNAQTQLVFENLPQNITSHVDKKDVEKAIRHWSHYPDGFQPFGDEVDEYARELLKKSGNKVRYALHWPKGQAVAFMILTEMFKEKKYDQAALWIGALGHGVGDAGAANHHSLIAWYCFMPEFTLKNGKKSQEFSFGSLPNCLKTKIGQEALEKAMRGFKSKLIVKPGPDMGKRALTRVMEFELEESEDLAKDAGLITKAWQMRVDAKTPAQIAEAEKTAAEGWIRLMVKPAKNIINSVVTANYLAEHNIPVTEADLEAALKIHESDYKKLTRKRSAQSDSIFEGLLDSPEKPAKIAVAYEPSYIMNHAQLGFESKYYAAAIMQALKEAGIPYQPLDVRSLIEKNGLDPKTHPLLILPATKNPSSYGTIMGNDVLAALKRYTDDGGRILQIGQAPLTIIAKNVVAVTKKKPWLPIDGKDLLNATFSFYSPDGKDDCAFKFSKTPFTRAGWHYPYVRVVFEKLNENQNACVQLTSGDESYILGVYVKKNDTIQHCFIPQLAVFPYLSKDAVSQDVSKALLDKRGNEILMSIINSMMLPPE